LDEYPQSSWHQAVARQRQHYARLAEHITSSTDVIPVIAPAATDIASGQADMSNVPPRVHPY
jgi:hypothetical protein